VKIPFRSVFVPFLWVIVFGGLFAYFIHIYFEPSPYLFTLRDMLAIAWGFFCGLCAMRIYANRTSASPQEEQMPYQIDTRPKTGAPSRRIDATVSGTFDLLLEPDGEHAHLIFNFPPDLPEDVKTWLRFTYCNDIVWRHHQRLPICEHEWFSTVKMDLYRKYFRHVHGQQYLVPGVE
jgi:hypothetical protein